jgi:ElaB/YqjD/DUF883 family membrane-anchored ribosome-binding protein
MASNRVSKTTDEQIDELKEVIRQAHEVLKDLRHATKFASDLEDHYVDNLWKAMEPHMTDMYRELVERVPDMAQKAVDQYIKHTATDVADRMMKKYIDTMLPIIRDDIEIRVREEVKETVTLVRKLVDLRVADVKQ